jgi:hypothetical protein
VQCKHVSVNQYFVETQTAVLSRDNPTTTGAIYQQAKCHLLKRANVGNL